MSNCSRHWQACRPPLEPRFCPLSAVAARASSPSLENPSVRMTSRRTTGARRVNLLSVVRTLPTANSRGQEPRALRF